VSARPSSRSRRRPAKPAEPRRRRSAEDAKRAILDATEARFAARGPAGIRLQDIAADVGVSHPAILHHFGSREDLIRAVIDRALGGLREEVLATLAVPDPTRIDVAALIERVFQTLGGHGQARLMAWLALADESGGGARREAGAFFVRETAETVHVRRTALHEAAGRRPPPFEDTLFSILLTSLALIGDALLGETTRASSGITDPAGGRRFRTWFAQLLVAHLAGGAELAAEPTPQRPRRRTPRPKR
jgi:AcrR family transcriptional regulator